MEKQTVKSICTKEYVPLDFGYKILKKLEHNGIAHSIRGKNGGYRLSKAPQTISILDVMLAMDTRLFISEEVEKRSYQSDKNCSISEEFGSLQGIWVDSLRNKTLDMLA